MGRYIASGLVTVISILENENADEIKNKEEVLKDIGKRVDLNLYDVKEYTNGYELYLKTGIVNKNLKDFIKELDESNPVSLRRRKEHCDENKKIWENNFKIKKEKNKTYSLYINDEKVDEDEFLGLWEYFNYVYLPDSFYDYCGYNIEIRLLMFSWGINKFMPERDPYILYLMNQDLKTFKNPLSTAFVYVIHC